jgi:hypothetical protein
LVLVFEAFFFTILDGFVVADLPRPDMAEFWDGE